MLLTVGRPVSYFVKSNIKVKREGGREEGGCCEDTCAPGWGGAGEGGGEGW